MTHRAYVLDMADRYLLTCDQDTYWTMCAIGRMDLATDEDLSDLFEDTGHEYMEAI